MHASSAVLTLECFRIVWDEAEVVRRIWERCLLAEGIKEELDWIEGQPGVQGKRAAERGERWKFAKVNERMRFLRYGAGNYFKGESLPSQFHTPSPNYLIRAAAHCDGTYSRPPETSDRSTRSTCT